MIQKMCIIRNKIKWSGIMEHGRINKKRLIVFIIVLFAILVSVVVYSTLNKKEEVSFDENDKLFLICL